MIRPKNNAFISNEPIYRGKETGKDLYEDASPKKGSLINSHFNQDEVKVEPPQQFVAPSVPGQAQPVNTDESHMTDTTSIQYLKQDKAQNNALEHMRNL